VRDRFTETLGVILSGLTSARLNHRRRYYNFDDVPMDLAPYEESGPPFFYAGTPKVAANLGMNVVGQARNLAPDTPTDVFAEYRQIIDERKRDGLPVYAKGDPLVVTTRHVFVAETDEEAFAIGRRAWIRYNENFKTTDLRIEGKSGSHPLVHDCENLERFIGLGTVIVGPPTRSERRCSISSGRPVPSRNYVVSAMQWGDITFEEASRSVDLYADEVMPALRKLGAEFGP